MDNLATPQNPENSTVLLLGNYRPALVIARYLNSLGYRVVSGYEGCDHGAEYSKYVDEIWDHHPAAENSEVFIVALKEFLTRRSDIKLIVPVSEIFVRIFAECALEVPDDVAVVMNAPHLVNACLDKSGMMDLARSLNVPVAPFQSATDLAGLSEAVDKLGFPVVVRPTDSNLRLFGQKAITLETSDCLKRWFSIWPEEQDELLVQSKAPGIRHNIYFAAKDGELLKYLHTRINRTDRLDGSGLAVDGVSVDPDPELQTYTSSLIKGLDYSGIGCAQYLVDASSGECIFLEINSRFAGNHSVPEFCGLGLTAFMMNMASGRSVENEAIEFGKPGVRYTWFIGDLEGLKLAIRKREIGIAGALRWFGKAVMLTLRTDLDMMFDRYDRKPAIAALIKVLPGFRHLPGLRAAGSLKSGRGKPAPLHPGDAELVKSH